MLFCVSLCLHFAHSLSPILSVFLTLGVDYIFREQVTLTNAFPDANLTTGKIISTLLNPQAHEAITKLWRDALPYGTSYEIEDIIKVAQDVYADYPVMLNA